jgi:hypothetical protein
MLASRCILLIFMAVFAPVANCVAQLPKANEDESQVNMAPLPDVLMSPSGTQIKAANQWPEQRQHWIKLISEHEYGFAPDAKAKVTWDIIEQGSMNDNKTVRRQYVVHLKTDAGQVDIGMVVFSPNTLGKPKGSFLGLNFRGNQTVHADPSIRMPTNWVPNDANIGITENRATDQSRGKMAHRWPIAEINARGYSLATAYYGDIDPDYDDDFKNGVHALFPEHRASAEHPNRWGTIAAWAWGLSRLLDVLVEQPFVDPERVAVIGHSRLGKAALWAGVTDERFQLVIANNSGCGGAAIERRNFGETVARINTVFPHWFCPSFRQYNQNEATLPFDSHTIVACVAPRPVYIASATKDLWADPKGEYLSGWYATPVYQLLGYQGLPSDTPPAADTSVGDRVGYHNRNGEHDLLLYDWEQYMNFASRHWR